LFVNVLSYHIISIGCVEIENYDDILITFLLL